MIKLGLKEKILDKSAKIMVIGGGYVGLPMGVRCANAGFDTVIFDLDMRKIENIRNGISYIKDVSNEELTNVSNNKLFAIGSIFKEWNNTLSYDCDIFLICVPTPLDKLKDPDVSYVLDAAQSIMEIQKWHSTESQKLVVLESTVYPGFTEDVLYNKLPDNFFVAFSAERVDPGNDKFQTKNTPKVVGGIDEASTDLSVLFYNQIVDSVVRVSNCRVAEMSKILENSFRMINIGFINEMALACQKMDVDIWEVIEAASTKPFGFMKFLPGSGLGGHCIPLDPHYLTWKLKTVGFDSKMINVASEVNSNMPKEVVRMTFEACNALEKSIRGSNILVVGVAYKPNIDDVRESPALDFIELLYKRGAKISYYDPYVEKVKFSFGDLKHTSVLEQYDCAVIITAHNDLDYEDIANHTRSIVDIRNIFKDIELPDGVFKLVL